MTFTSSGSAGPRGEAGTPAHGQAHAPTPAATASVSVLGFERPVLPWTAKVPLRQINLGHRSCARKSDPRRPLRTVTRFFALSSLADAVLLSESCECAGRGS